MSANNALMTVSTRSVRPVIERLRALALDAEAVLTSAGCQPAALGDPDGRISHATALAVWQEAVRCAGDDFFGIHAAEQIRAGAFDVLDYATRSSATLGEGLQRLVRYQRILHNAAVVQLSVDGDSVRLTHALPGDAGELPRHTAEFIVAAWVVVARQATGTDFSPVEVTFRHSAPADRTEHERFFRAPIRFNSSANGVVLARSLLDLPLVKSDPGLCAVLERHMGELLEKVPQSTSFGARVRQLVVKDLSTSPPDATAVARKLHMSRRTLQRLLRAEGTTFTELVDALRHDLAMRYLREPAVAIAEVAFLLGFSEASAFHRAFRRWQGTTPAAYRANLSAGE
jgi:AraC-like DNA-binding protein